MTTPFSEILRHLTPANVLKWLAVVFLFCLAVISILWIGAQAWNSS